MSCATSSRSPHDGQRYIDFLSEYCPGHPAIQRNTALYAIVVARKNTIFSASLESRQPIVLRFFAMTLTIVSELEFSAIRNTAIVLARNVE